MRSKMRIKSAVIARRPKADEAICFKTRLLRHVLCCLAMTMVAVTPLASASGSSVKILEEMPVQHNGRIKPFQSFAREASLAVTGRYKFKGMNAPELVWRWLTEPEVWNAKPFLPAAYKPLAGDFGLMIIEGRVSPEVALGHESFLEKVREAQARRERKEKLTLLDEKRLELYDRASLFREVAGGKIPGWIAHPEDPRAGWAPFASFAAPDAQATLAAHFPAENLSDMIASVTKLLGSVQKNGLGENSIPAAKTFTASQKALFEARGVYVDEDLIRRELMYNRVHPFGWAWKLYLLALVLSAIFAPAQKFKQVWLPFFAAGFILHTFGFYMRCTIAGRPPVTNMYESIIWVSWGAVFFAAVLYAIHRAKALPLAASAVAAIALLLADGFPVLLDASITPLVPVLRSNFWLTIHVLTITLSYAAFALAWGLGHAAVVGFAFGRPGAEWPQHMTQQVYRAMQIGVILLASGTVLGGVWANYSWGRFWGWDPKETWALIALLGYLAVLHGRFAGWLGTFGLAAGSVVCFLSVVMAWYGVNFVLAAGLHSYGFGGGGAGYVFAVALADLAFTGACAAVYRRKVQPVSKAA